MRKDAGISRLAKSEAIIGEAPVWIEEEGRVYWVDTETRRAFSFRPEDGERKEFSLPMAGTALLRRSAGGWIAVAKEGLGFWNQESGEFSLIAAPVRGHADLCFNDGAIDRRGALIAGTMNFREHRKPEGALFRLSPDLELTILDTGLKVANGIGFSPDGGTLYLSEQFAHRILAYDYDDRKGTVSGKRVFAEVPEEAGLPDGITVDSEGCVWNGRWGGGRIARFAPDGGLLEEYGLPVPVGTCVGFGGEGYRRLFITSARYRMDEDELAANPGSGDLFAFEPGAKGIPEPRFAG